jgi:hypothetical protein
MVTAHATAEQTPLDQVRQELRTSYDREAHRLMAGAGPFTDLCGEDDSLIEAVDRLLGDNWTFTGELAAAAKGPLAVLEVEILLMRRLNDVRDVAYLLGVAVGRRLRREKS